MERGSASGLIWRKGLRQWYPFYPFFLPEALKCQEIKSFFRKRIGLALSALSSFLANLPNFSGFLALISPGHWKMVIFAV